MKVLKNLGIVIGLVAVIAIGTNLGNSRVIEQIVPDNFGGIGIGPITIIGITPTSTNITTYNTESFSTSTPEQTDYVSLGQDIDKVDLFIHANNTSTDLRVLNWGYEISPFGANRATSTLTFYSISAGSSSGGTITWQPSTTTNTWTLPRSGGNNIVFPVCNNNYDGADDIPACNAGWYKFNINIGDGTGLEIYAEVNAKSFR